MTQKEKDTKNDLWLMLSLAVSSPEFPSLTPSERANIINTAKELFTLIPTA